MYMLVCIQYNYVYVCDVVLVVKLENVILIKSCQTGGNAKVMD